VTKPARSGLPLLCLLLAFAAAAEPGHPVTMWRVDGTQNRLYLLGSVHLLRPADHPLPSVIGTAYADAETIVMEVDMDDTDPVAAQQQVTAFGLARDGRSLDDLMGPRLYARAEALAADAEIPLAMLARTEPWLAAITVEQLMLARIGFDPKYGVENHLVSMAVEDGKPVIGLETLRQQLEFLDGMSLPAQRALLLQSLEQSAGIEQVMDELVHAWRYGDIEYLEAGMLGEMQDYPELYRIIVAERNRNWLAAIERYAREEDDYLVVVGALHLIGDDGVPVLLERRGFNVVQMHQP
jgi:uncharacterized protein